jgi:phosphatidylglycerol:prolipoprotein diacylglycerol transferase
MLAIAFFAGLWYIKKRSTAEKLPFDQMLNIAYILIFCGVIGARLGYVLLHLSEFADNPLSAINPFQAGRFGIAGLNLYGGVILALPAVWLYLRLKKLPLLAVFDILVPTVGLGLGLGRIGCFLNGCCFGTPTGLPWGITFPTGSLPDGIFPHQAIHPAQIYSSAYGFVLFFALHQILKRKRFDGQVMAIYLMVEAFFRYFIEYVRYYESEMHLPFLGMEPTWNQVASVSLFVLGLAIYIWVPRKLYRESEAAQG